MSDREAAIAALVDAVNAGEWDDLHALAERVERAYTEFVGWQLRGHDDPYCTNHCEPGFKHSQCGCRCNHRQAGRKANRR